MSSAPFAQLHLLSYPQQQACAQAKPCAALACRAQEQPGDRLIVPHPRWRERGFVQAPLADLWPAGSVPPPAMPQLAAATAAGAAGPVTEPPPPGAALGPLGVKEIGVAGLEGRLQQAWQLWEAAGGECQVSL